MKRISRGITFFAGSLAAVMIHPAWSNAQAADAPIPNPQASGDVIASNGQVLSPSTQPAATQITMNFKDASIDAVLDYLSQTAGFFVIKEVPVTGRVTVFNRSPISPEDAVKYLNSALKNDGFTAIQMGKVLKITTLANAKHADIPVHIGNDPEKIDTTDELITQIIPVRSVDAVKLKTDILPLVNTEADLTANAASNTLIITDTSANVRRVVEIVSSLDKRESSATDIRVRQLKYADATAAAKLITDIFNPQASQTQNQTGFGGLPFFRFGGGGGGPGGGGGGGRGGGGFGGGGFGGGGAPGGGGGGGAAQQSDAGDTGHVQASADQRTNTVVVSGPPDTLTVIDGMLTKLDSDPAAEEDFFIYQVKNGQAVDMASTLNGLFSGTTANSATANRSQFASGTGNRVSGSGAFGGGGGAGGVGGGGGGFGGGGGGFGGGGGGGFGGGGAGAAGGANRAGTNGGVAGIGNGLTGRTGAGGALGANGAGGAAGAGGVADLIGQVYVVADQDTNSLLVATATKFESRVKGVIDQLDRRVPQVLIKVLIAEVTHDNALDFGTDFSILDVNRNQTEQKKEQFFSGTTGANAAIAAAAANGTPSGMIATLLEGNISVTLQALAQQNKLDILSRPYILTSDNQEADITVGSEVPFITSTDVDSNGGIHNNAQYQDIGIILTVTPHINPEGMVTMLVSPQISSLTSKTVTIQQGVDLPVFDVRSADSYLTVHDGQTVVIGGMMQDQKTEAVSKIPILGDIPFIGKLLFSYNTTDKTKTELLIFLTPHVAADPTILKPMANDEMHGLRLTPNAVEPGVFQDHLQGLERGRAATNPSTMPSSIFIPPPTKQDSILEPSHPGGN